MRVRVRGLSDRFGHNDAETGVQVPVDVAARASERATCKYTISVPVDEPGARVVCLEADGDIVCSVVADRNNIAHDGVIKVVC